MDTNIMDEFLYAVRRRNLTAVRELISSPELRDMLEGRDGYDLLAYAVEAKDTEMAKLLLQNHCRVNTIFDRVDTPLHFAVRNDEPELVRMLLDEKADINAQDAAGRTPLYLAVDCKKKDADETEVLLTRTAFDDIQQNNNETGAVIIIGDLILPKVMGIIGELVKRGASVDIGDNSGVTPLHVAVDRNLLKTVVFLLSNQAASNSTSQAKFQEGFTPLHTACSKGYWPIAWYLVKTGAAVNSVTTTSTFTEGYSPLHFAAKHSCTRLLRLLLKHGANIDIQNKEGKTVLDFVAEQRNVPMLELILKYRPDIYNKNHKRVIESLLQYDLTADSQEKYNSQVLHAVVSKGYLTVLQQLLHQGLDANTHFLKHNNCRLLHVAAGFGQEEISILLINHGAIINAEDRYRQTPLMHATVNNHLKIIELLLQHGADINSCDKCGSSVLHLAASITSNDLTRSFIRYDINPETIKKKEEISKFFISKGANVNARDNFGKTPLYVSVENKIGEITKLLLREGADINVKNSGGRSAIEEAVRHVDKKSVELLLNHHADIDSTSVLHETAKANNLELVALLLKFVDEIDVLDKHGMTALMYAAREGHTEIVNALLGNGSDVNVVSSGDFGTNKTAFQILIERSNQLNWSPNGFENTIQYLLVHIILILCADLPLVQQNKDLALSQISSSFREDCAKEVATMKTQKIANMNVSFYAILKKNEQQLAVCLRNEDIVNVLESNDYREKFPRYASLINIHFKKGMKRKGLLEDGNKLIQLIFSDFVLLPDHCKQHILSYLSNKDLRILINAYEGCHPH